MKTKVLFFLSILFLVISIFYLTTVMAAVPTVLTNDATDIDTSSAKLHGDHTDNGGRNTGFEWFEYGTTIGYGGETTHILVFAGGGFGLFEAIISELEQGTIYHFRACAENMDGVSYGSDKTFVTIGENNKPNITCVYPANNSIDLDRKPQCHVCVNDTDLDNLSVSFYYNNSGNWILDYNETNVSSDSIVYWNFTEAEDYEILYQWKVIVNDSTNETIGNYSFTTNRDMSEDKTFNKTSGTPGEGSPPPSYTNPSTPGFEAIFILIAISMIFIICRKRKK